MDFMTKVNNKFVKRTITGTSYEDFITRVTEVADEY